MKIFISYAHVDEHPVREMVDILRDAGHDPWFDHRLTVGIPWEQQLLNAIKTCDRFLYALTPESVSSKWCQWEFAQAVHLGKPIIPVLVQANTQLDDALGRVQYADFSKGPTPSGVARLMAGIRDAQCIPVEWVPEIPIPQDEPERPVKDPVPKHTYIERFFDDAYQAFRDGDYDDAHDLLLACLDMAPDHAGAKALLKRTVQRLNIQNADPLNENELSQPRLIDVPMPSVERQTPDTPKSTALEKPSILPEPFEWVEIPGTAITFDNVFDRIKSGTLQVEPFAITKYPVTNLHYRVFMDAGGYNTRDYWTENGWMTRLREGWIEPRFRNDGNFNSKDNPVVGISWYEAMAFCRWLSETTGEPITLPTTRQWQRTAQGDDRRTYPWGSVPPNETLCNWNNNVGRTTPVQQYPKGISPYGVMDMSGNVFEWCLTGYGTELTRSGRTADQALRGGSWSSINPIALRANNHMVSNPDNWDKSIGFRCVLLP